MEYTDGWGSYSHAKQIRYTKKEIENKTMKRFNPGNHVKISKKWADDSYYQQQLGTESHLIIKSHDGTIECYNLDGFLGRYNDSVFELVETEPKVGDEVTLSIVHSGVVDSINETYIVIIENDQTSRYNAYRGDRLKITIDKHRKELPTEPGSQVLIKSTSILMSQLMLTLAKNGTWYSNATGYTPSQVRSMSWY